MSLIVSDTCDVVTKFPIPLLASQLQGAKQQYAAELEQPYVEVAMDLEVDEDAEHKLVTFCGLEEIPVNTKMSLFSAFHTLLQEDRLHECSRTTALPSIAALTTQAIALQKQAKSDTSSISSMSLPSLSPALPTSSCVSPSSVADSPSSTIEHVLSSRFLQPAQAWRAAYHQSWQPSSLKADVLSGDSAHVLTANRNRPAGSGGALSIFDEFSVPVKAVITQAEKPILSLQDFMESPRRFAEVFNLIVRVHPNHAQHLRLLFTLERQFAKTLGTTFSSMERALWLLQEQQNREMENASHLALSDPSKIADLVHSHLDQRRVVEERWGTEIQALKKRQIKEYAEFIFNFYRSHILPTLITQPRSKLSHLGDAPWNRFYDFSMFSSPSVLPPSAAAAITPLPNRSAATRMRWSSENTPAWQPGNNHANMLNMLNDPMMINTALSTVPSSAAPTSASSTSSFSSSSSSVAGASVISSAYSQGPDPAADASNHPSTKEAAAHAQQVAALLAAQAQEQKEREREEVEASLNASLVGSGARQKVQEIVMHNVWLGGQRKTMFTIRLIVGDILDLLACEFGPTDLSPRCQTLHTLYSDTLSACVVPHDSCSLLEITTLNSPEVAQLLAPWLAQPGAAGIGASTASSSSSASSASTPSPSALMNAHSRGIGGSLSPRIRALVAAIERTTDFHFPSLAAQVRYSLLALSAKSPVYRHFLHVAKMSLDNPALQQQWTATSSAPASQDGAMVAAGSKKGKKKDKEKEKVNNMLNSIPTPTFSSALQNTLSVLDKEDADANDHPSLSSSSAITPSSEPQPTASSSSAASAELPTPPHMLEAGDYLITRHSNLRDAQLLFHLMGAKPPKKVKSSKNDMVKTHAQALEGLRHIINTADRSGVASLVIPVLLSGTYKGTKHSLPPATQRELESVFRLVRTTLLDLANSAGSGSTDHSLNEVKLLIPLADASAVLHTTPFDTLMEFALIKQARAAYAEAFSW